MTLVSPTRTDQVAASASAFLGGPLGRWSRPGPPARALQVVLGAGALMFLLGALRTVPCVRVGWAQPQREMLLCYSDIPVLYQLRGIAEGGLPYLTSAGDRPLEYPVLTGLFTWFAAQFSSSPTTFYWVTVVLLLGCFLVALAATAVTVPSRVWDGLLMALAPSVALAGLINWDWFAVALTAGFGYAWSRSRTVLAGVLLGLAVAAKFYPLLLLGPLLLLCWRRGRLGDFWRTAGAAAISWGLVNLPFALLAPQGWSYFFRFSSERGEDFGSIWYAGTLLGFSVPAAALNQVALLSLLVLCLGIAVLIARAPRPPRFAQVAFLVVAAFLVTNKVYSPQFVLWLLPLAVLARPRWRDLLVWQAAEGAYFVAIWWHLVALDPQQQGLAGPWYAAAVLVHIAGTGYFAALVVRDVLLPEHDPVRTDEECDDPGGGVLDGAEDRWGPGRQAVRAWLGLTVQR